ncbi:MAG TPA: pyruvate dehydrogenase complex dihydrolipoamide acetyltransferase [Verrucomicrobiae bacterium]|nr:pyruvate dehydrogenase complex dihydrolipoamide acetyltransferase [Verrucomicrobiae bacterium]
MPYVEMPKLSDTMTEGTVVKWRKAVGDTVSVGDVLAEIETDKAVMELEAFDDGTLKEIYVQEGGKVRIGDKLALLLGAGESAPKAANQIPATEKNNAAKQVQEIPAKTKTESAPVSVSASSNSNNRVKASPLAKKIAAAKKVDLTAIQGSGPGGRIVAKDLDSASAKISGATTIAPAIQTAGDSKRIPLSGMRKIIAERLLASKTQIPHFYLNIEVDAGELLKLRAQTNEYLEKSGAGKLTINDLVLKAVIAAAVKVPRVNATYAGDAIIEYADVHLSVAVAVEDGLVTPVIRQAQKKSLREISDAVKDLATRARTKKLKPEEYQGGTLTVSNLGSYGIESFSAVINPPQAMILAIGAIVKKPVVNANDEIVVAQRMAIGLSADHRVVDGAIGAQYLAELRRLLENPVWMLL